MQRGTVQSYPSDRAQVAQGFGGAGSFGVGHCRFKGTFSYSDTNHTPTVQEALTKTPSPPPYADIPEGSRQVVLCEGSLLVAMKKKPSSGIHSKSLPPLRKRASL